MDGQADGRTDRQVDSFSKPVLHNIYNSTGGKQPTLDVKKT